MVVLCYTPPQVRMPLQQKLQHRSYQTSKDATRTQLNTAQFLPKVTQAPRRYNPAMWGVCSYTSLQGTEHDMLIQQK